MNMPQKNLHHPETVTLVNEEQWKLVQCLAPLRWHCHMVHDDDIVEWENIADELEFLASEIVDEIRAHARFFAEGRK